MLLLMMLLMRLSLLLLMMMMMKSGSCSGRRCTSTALLDHAACTSSLGLRHGFRSLEIIVSRARLRALYAHKTAADQTARDGRIIKRKRLTVDRSIERSSGC
jgi:hypothetical protein